MRFSEVIRQWFATEWGGSMVLPDGWFGRPYDNQHLLTSLDEAVDSLVMVLDEVLTLEFKGLKSVSQKNGDLIIGPFENLDFKWSPYGGGQRNNKKYSSGEVKMISSRKLG